MAPMNPPLYLQGGIYPASVDVTGIAAMFAADDAAQTTRSGVIFNNLSSLRVTASGGTSVSVADGRAVVDNGRGGAYLCTNRGSTPVSVPNPGPNPRRDIIGVQVLDQENGDAGNIWALTRIPGTAQPVPVDPPQASWPDFFIPLARVRMPADTSTVQNSYVDDMRTFTAAAGGVIVCDSVHRPAVTKVPSSQIIFELDTGLLKVYNGTRWADVGGSPVVAVDGSSVALIVKGFVGQTANLQEWRNDANTVLARVAPDGNMYVGANQVVTADDTIANATNATYAASAGSAGSAGYAGSAGSAPAAGGSADYATNAGYASSAGSAPASGGIAAAVVDSSTYSINCGWNGLTMTKFGGGGARTAVWDNSGNITASPSSRRFKKNIEPAAGPDADAVLNLTPVNFDFDGDVDGVDDVLVGLGRQFGLIAEDVDDLGLTDVVSYDDQNRPANVFYEKVSLLLLPIIREQRDRIAALTSRLDALAPQAE